MNDKKLSKEESLEVIEQMIALAKNKINNNGFHFILWGMLIALMSLVIYILQRYNSSGSYFWLWLVLPFMGFPLAFIYERRKSTQKKIVYRLDKLYSVIWIGFGITLSILVAIAILNHINPLQFIFPVVGFAIFITGFVYKFSPLIVGAFLFWFCAIFCTFVSEDHFLLLNALAFTCGYIIPGILLSRKKERYV